MSSAYFEGSSLVDRLRNRGFWKRLALLIAIPAFVAFVLFLVLWRTFFQYVPPGHMLVIISKSGQPLAPGQVLADAGQKGILREVLGEGYHFVMPVIYTTKIHPNFQIAPGKVGILTAQDGKVPTDGRVLAEDGEQGIRRTVLLPGSYRLNPYGFKVEQVDMVHVEPGHVGVKRRMLGKDPQPAPDGKQQLFATNPDEKGIIRNEVLQPGIYPLNTKEYEVISCEVGIYQTTYHYIRSGGVSSAITFPAKDGNEISLDCTIEWEVKPEFWPLWLAKFGTLQNIERIVIDQHVRKICRDRGFNYGAQDFLEGDKREKFQQDFRAELDRVCEADNVEVRSAFIRNIIIPDRFLQQKRDQQLAVETGVTSEALTLTAQTSAEVAKAERTIDLRVAEVKAETARMVAVVDRDTENVRMLTEAEVEKLKAEYGAKIAELDAERKQTMGEAEAQASKLKETAISSLYKMKLDVFNQDSDAFLRYTMAQQLNPKMQLRLFHSGTGTLWTNMGNKNMNFMMPLPSGDSKSAADRLPTGK